ncbi:MAG: YraN family protein [Planctomycetaceae bacterium]|nr:YraN family protein [Planctomycetaceae bacterium]
MKAQLRAWWRSHFGPFTLGEQGERLAARQLRRQGYKIITLRHRLRYGEFDVIAVDGETIVFVEVKTRRGPQLARPATAVDAQRRQRMTRAALAYMKSHDLLDYPARFDIVEVLWPDGPGQPQIAHHKAAFRAEGRGQFFR